MEQPTNTPSSFRVICRILLAVIKFKKLIEKRISLNLALRIKFHWRLLARKNCKEIKFLKMDGESFNIKISMNSTIKTVKDVIANSILNYFGEYIDLFINGEEEPLDNNDILGDKLDLTVGNEIFLLQRSMTSFDDCKIIINKLETYWSLFDNNLCKKKNINGFSGILNNYYNRTQCEILFNLCQTCTCCEKHQHRRPTKLEDGLTEKWLMTKRNNTLYSRCLCKCRSFSRHLCRGVYL